MKKTFKQRLSGVYVFLVAFSVVPMLVFTVSSIHINRVFYIAFWIALEIAADMKPFRIVHDQQMDMTMSFAVQLSAIILLGTGEAIWVIVIATLIVELLSKRPWNRMFFNVGQYGLTVTATGYLFHMLKLSTNVPLDIIIDLPALFIAVSTYYLLNTFFISVVISLTSGNRFKDIFFSDFRIIASYYFSLAPISIAVSLLYKEEKPYIILIMIPPLIMADQALRRYYSLHQETQETLKVLANTVDERDKYTFDHSVHVAEYSGKIAQKLGLSLDEVNEVIMAGQVHDLGKVGIADEILNKPDRLNDDEYEKIKQHPEIGYRLLKNLKPYKKGAEYVLYHHERIDGKGYPRGISGKSIPLGARILTVADSYDAMTTDRPYRAALSQDTAVNELVKFSGIQFDPDVVNTFIEILKSDYGYRG